MGKLIATTQATIDGVVDPVREWVQADGDLEDAIPKLKDEVRLGSGPAHLSPASAHAPLTS